MKNDTTNLSPYHCDLLEQEAELWDTLQSALTSYATARAKWNNMHTICINAGLEDYVSE
jgi:hypothetical protein